MDDRSENAIAENAAYQLAEGRLTLDQIAAEAGVTRKTIFNWRSKPEFAAKIEAFQREIHAAIRKHGIAVRENRIAALNDRWVRMRQVIEARADDPKFADTRGGTTGLLVLQVKSIGQGDKFERIEVVEFDASLIREIREHEKQAALEMGQWPTVDKPEGFHIPPEVDPDKMTDVQLDAYLHWLDLMGYRSRPEYTGANR